MKVVFVFLMSFFIPSVYAMESVENQLGPFLPYDLIEDIVCFSYVDPIKKACRSIIDEPYKEENSVLCCELIQEYKKIVPLKRVCKRALTWFDKKWYEASCEYRQKVLELTPDDCNALLQKSVVYQHKCCFYFSLLLGADANATIITDDKSGIFLQGSVPLFLSIYNGDFDMFSLLLQYGAHTDVKTLGSLTPERVAHAIMDTYTAISDRLPYRRMIAALHYEKKKRKQLRQEAEK